VDGCNSQQSGESFRITNLSLFGLVPQIRNKVALLFACLKIPLGSLGLLAWFPKGTFAKRAENKQAKEIPSGNKQAKEIPLGSLGLLAWFPKGTFAKQAKTLPTSHGIFNQAMKSFLKSVKLQIYFYEQPKSK